MEPSEIYALKEAIKKLLQTILYTNQVTVHGRFNLTMDDCIIITAIIPMSAISDTSTQLEPTEIMSLLQTPIDEPPYLFTFNDIKLTTERTELVEGNITGRLPDDVAETKYIYTFIYTYTTDLEYIKMNEADAIAAMAEESKPTKTTENVITVIDEATGDTYHLKKQHPDGRLFDLYRNAPVATRTLLLTPIRIANQPPNENLQGLAISHDHDGAYSNALSLLNYMVKLLGYSFFTKAHDISLHGLGITRIEDIDEAIRQTNSRSYFSHDGEPITATQINNALTTYFKAYDRALKVNTDRLPEVAFSGENYVPSYSPIMVPNPVDPRSQPCLFSLELTYEFTDGTGIKHSRYVLANKHMMINDSGD